MTEYDPTNPFDGSIIQNADICYMTRIEVQGGGIVNTLEIDITAGEWQQEKQGYGELVRDQLRGSPPPVNQLNSPMSFTIIGLEPRRLLRRRGLRPPRSAMNVDST